MAKQAISPSIDPFAAPAPEVFIFHSARYNTYCRVDLSGNKPYPPQSDTSTH
jgi:hypothetical protein